MWWEDGWVTWNSVVSSGKNMGETGCKRYIDLIHVPAIFMFTGGDWLIARMVFRGMSTALGPTSGCTRRSSTHPLWNSRSMQGGTGSEKWGLEHFKEPLRISENIWEYLRMSKNVWEYLRYRLASTLEIMDMMNDTGRHGYNYRISILYNYYNII